MKIENPLLSNWTYPPFNQIKTEHYLPAFEQSIALAKQEIDAITNNPLPANFSNTIEALDRSGETYAKVVAVFFNILEAEADQELQQIAQQIIPLTVQYANYVSLNETLFERIKAVYQQRETLQLSVEQLTLLTQTYDSFLRSGACLDTLKKKEYETITKKLSDLKLSYKENVLAATTSYFLHFTPQQAELLSTIPDNELDLASQRSRERGFEDGWLFDLSMPSYTAFLKYASCRSKRKELYLAYNTRALNGKHDNRQIVREIVNLRLQMANLLGYSSYAHYVLEKRMLKNSREVNEFLSLLLDSFMPAAQRERDLLQTFAQQKGLEGDLQPWDWAYYANLQKKERYHFDEQEIKPFFALEKVQKGIFELVHQLYGLTFEQDASIAVYQQDVVAFRVFDKDKSPLAILYMDYFPRKTKRNGAWMTSFVDQHVDKEGKNILPEISLVFNFTPSTKQTPSLLTLDEANTFLHEFGHALHGMLSEVTYSSLSGTSVSRDFVEMPSQVMENWLYQPNFLTLFAYHYQTEQPIDFHLIEKIKSAENYLVAYACVRQLNFGFLDMAFHQTELPIEEDIVAFEKKATEPTRLLPFVENTSISTAFSHIFDGGYAAGYYGYKWSEVLDADVFESFLEKIDNPSQVANRFRTTILSKGGTDEAMTLFVNFKGRKPSVEALLRRCEIKK